MFNHRITPLLLPFLIQPVTAAQEVTPTAALTIQDYFIILIAGILLLGFFLAILKRIFYRAGAEIEQSSVVYVVGMLFAFIFVAAGSLLFISSILILIAIGAQVATFQWMVLVLQAYFSSTSVGILAIAAIGLILFLVGIYLVVSLQGNPFFNPYGTPTRSRMPPKIERDEVELEPLNPTLTFKVLDREKDDPLPDVKVILKQMNGTRVYTKYTEFNGEVTFYDVHGYGSEYFAYVEGDDRREKFRVLRKKASD
ncbi:MAG: hypothetical protein LUO82_00955 [Methanomicrobiales archaeon]|nr:hypothetical protein [Methanomicrobiales archaeon]